MDRRSFDFINNQNMCVPRASIGTNPKEEIQRGQLWKPRESYEMFASSSSPLLCGNTEAKRLCFFRDNSNIVLYGFTHDIEAVSCDELFVDCTNVLSDTGATAQELAQLLRKEVFDKTGCTTSVGIGPNILLARLATKKAKPNGVFQVLKHEAKDFIKDQNVSDLPGVGYSMSKKLARLGVTICGELQSVSQSMLRREFGPKTGESLHRFSLGIDDREVKGNKQRKSVSAEVNYGIRFTQESDAFKFLRELSGEVAKRLDGLGVKGRSITLKLMVKRPDAPAESAKFMGHGICNTVTKSTILPMATNDADQIGQEVVAMYKYHKISAPDVRGIGIQVQKLESRGGRIDYQSHSGSACQSILRFAISRKPPTNRDMNAPAPQIIGSEGAGTHAKYANEEPHLVPLHSSKNLFKGKLDAGSELSAIKDVSFLLSPSQVSENILDELPADIAQEIRTGMERHRNSNSLPSRAGNSTTAVDDNATSNFYTISHRCDDEVDILDELPSESQLDMSCFHALPQSLQKELEDAYTKHKRGTKSSENHNSPTKHPREGLTADVIGKDNQLGNEQHGTSHPSTSSNTHDSVVNVVNELPSQSQLDMSCFHALPRSLQKELEAEYARQKKTNKAEGKCTSPIKGTALEKLKSPSKDKGKKHKKRRGRPPGSKKRLHCGNVTKPLVITSRQQRENLRNVTGPKESLSVADKVVCVDDDSPDNDSRDIIDERHKDGNDQDNFEVTHPVYQPKVEFCGATSLKDVKNLFKEWIESCTEPGDSDVAMVTKYLTSLVHHKCLEQTFCLLKFLRRYIQMSSRSIVWKQCADLIATLVQSVVMEAYGSQLKLI